jgi:hypothetical protein
VRTFTIYILPQIWLGRRIKVGYYLWGISRIRDIQMFTEFNSEHPNGKEDPGGNLITLTHVSQKKSMCERGYCRCGIWGLPSGDSYTSGVLGRGSATVLMLRSNLFLSTYTDNVSKKNGRETLTHWHCITSLNTCILRINDVQVFNLWRVISTSVPWTVVNLLTSRETVASFRRALSNRQ